MLVMIPILDDKIAAKTPPLQLALARLTQQRDDEDGWGAMLVPDRLFGILRNLLSRTARHTGSTFLDAACAGFAAEFGAEFVFITRTTDTPPTTVRMLAAHRNGAPVVGWEFPLKGTPCEGIFEKPVRDTTDAGLHIGVKLISRDVQRLFTPARDSGYEAFIGVPLWSGDGRMIGHIALFFSRTLDQTGQQEQLLELVRLYALRVEAELNRILLDESRLSLMAALRETNTRLESECITDGLTGLYNRRHFSDCMVRAFARRQRQHQPFGLILVDIDHFKKINDTYGHGAGDQVLLQVSKVLLSSTRKNVEEVFRIGGEEFAVLCNGVLTQGNLASAAARIVEAVREAAILYEGNPLQMTVSVGGAFPLAKDKDWDTCFRRADQHLYEAKSLGRDRAVVGGGETGLSARCQLSEPT